MNIKINIQNFGSFDLFNFDSWYPKLSKKLSIIEILDIVLIGLKQQYSNKNKTLKEEEKDKIGIIIKDVQNIKGFFEVSDKLNLSDQNDLVVAFFKYLKEKDFYSPYFESWVAMIEAEKWSYSKLYSEYLRSLEHKDWSYAYKYAQIITMKQYNAFFDHTRKTNMDNLLKLFKLPFKGKHELLTPIKTNILQKNENAIKTEFDKITKIFKETLKPEYMIIPEIIRPEITRQCSFLAFDIIGFSNTENNDEIDMLDYFEDMLKQFRYEMGKIKGIVPEDVAVLYVGDCLAISLKCNNHAEILFNFTKKISKQSQFDKYTFALHTGEAYWINFKEYEETPFKQLIHPEVNYLFRLIGKSKNENYIYISKKMYDTLQNKPSFKQEQQSIISDEKEDNETIAQNIYYTQQIKHNYFVEYIKFKRR